MPSHERDAAIEAAILQQLRDWLDEACKADFRFKSHSFDELWRRGEISPRLSLLVVDHRDSVDDAEKVLYFQLIVNLRHNNCYELFRRTSPQTGSIPFRRDEVLKLNRIIRESFPHTADKISREPVIPVQFLGNIGDGPAQHVA